MKKLFCFVMFISALSLFAQPAIKFENTTIDFGNIKEEDGKVSGKFEFINTGNQDLLLTSVKPGCGCTAADYTKTPVAPGEKGFIMATYNPYNRPGGFNKHIKVTTNEPKFDGSENTPYTIYIKGNVEKRPPTKYELAGYKNGNGEIRVKENQIKLEMLSTGSKTFTIMVTNFSDKESTFEPTNLPSFITMEKSVPVLRLNAEEEREITFKYDAAKRAEIGNYNDIINIQTQDPVEYRITLNVESTITEDFSNLTPKQLLDAPKAVLDSLTLHFGKIEKNTNPTMQVNLYNKGKNPLIIRQLRSPNSVFTIVSDKTEISKGASATLTVTLNSKNRRGAQDVIVEIITNDPANSHILLNCKGEILQ